MGALNGQELQIDDGPVEALAIIGFSARLPGDATSAEAFWSMLIERRTAHGLIPEDRLHANAFYHPNPDRTGSFNTKTGHFLQGDIGAFDAPFFSIQPSEAKSMDPQQRILLETAYGALENAGISMEKAAGSNTSVYVGASARDYETLQTRDPEDPAKYLGTGVGTALLANRISWFYNLRGPSMALDTAGSSSLNALHLACQSLRSRESDMTLVGGVNLIIAPDSSFMHLSNMGFFSPDGRSYSFDNRANGFAKGEGVGIVVLKRLKDAICEGDTIRAVIRSTGSNQDGRTPGITQPSRAAQEANIRDVYRSAGLSMSTTQFLEAHGTGTQIGDPIEAGAIAEAFGRRPDNPLLIGAVKSNIGHLEAASGIAALIKTVIVLEKGIIPPNALYGQPNSAIPIEQWHLKFPTHIMPWPTPGLRRASVNAFGYGGTNAHVVLDDAYHYLKLRNLKGNHNTTITPAGPSKGGLSEHCNGSFSKQIDVDPNRKKSLQSPRIFFFSAADKPGLGRLAAAYEIYLSSLPNDIIDQQDVFLENLSYTLTTKRSNLPWKAFAVANSIEALRQNLRIGLSSPVRSSTSPCLAFVFTGQGAQWYAMGRELEIYPVFRNSLVKAEKHLQSFGCQWYLLDELHKVENFSRINKPDFSQPMCTALQLALVDLLYSWNITPQAVVGHSSGEIAAAYCIGALSFDSSLKISYHRGRLAASLAEKISSPGGMISIGMSEAEIGPFLDQVKVSEAGEAVIGCVNSPKNVTISGDISCVNALNALMEDQRVFARKLRITLAYHSPHMGAIASEYLAAIQYIGPERHLSQDQDDPRQPRMFSSVYGSVIQPGQLSDPQYWVTNMVSTVRFSEALEHLTLDMISRQEERTATRLSQTRYLEIGPHSSLRRPLQDTVSGMAGVKPFAYDSLLERGVSALETCLQAIGRLRCSGFVADMTRINIQQSMRTAPQMLVNLPGYPFKHDHVFWHEPRISKNYRFRKHARHELLGSPSVDWNPLEPRWRHTIKMSENPWMQDHKMSGLEIYPAAGLIVMALEAARQISDSKMAIKGCRLNNLQFLKALHISSAPEGVETQLHLHPLRGVGRTSKEYDFALYVHADDDWSMICRGSIVVEFLKTDLKIDKIEGIDNGQSTLCDTFNRGIEACNNSVDVVDLYGTMARCGYDFGPTHQVLENVWYSRDKQAKATIDLDCWTAKVTADPIKPHIIHPTDLDGVLQLAIVAFSKGGSAPSPTMVPTNVRSMWVSNSLVDRPSETKLEALAKTTFQGYREADFWIAAFNDKGPQIVIDGWRQMAVSNLELTQKGEDRSRRLCYNLVWRPDITMLSPNQTKEHCEVESRKTQEPPKVSMVELELATYYFISRTIETLGHCEHNTFPATYSKYIEWMKRSRKQFKRDREMLVSGDLMHVDAVESLEMEFKNMARSSAHGALVVAVGENLIQILRGAVDPLDLFFGGNLARAFYYGDTLAGSYAAIVAYMDLMAHKNPSLKILEIGAGTGAATTPILQALWCRSDTKEMSTIPRFTQYDFTDVSPKFFDEARQAYKEYGELVSYQTLDIERDPIQQGFKAQHYDVVICSLVLHATTELKRTLENTKKLLQPGGKLILLEPTNKECLNLPFIFGLLPGWWLGIEETRQWSPLLSEEEWDSTLIANGFSGAEICLRDYERPDSHTNSIIVSSAINPSLPQSPCNRPIFIIAAEEDRLQRKIAEGLLSALAKPGSSNVHITSDEGLRSTCLDDTVCIFLKELHKPYLLDIQEPDLALLKKMVTECHAIIWVTKGTGESQSSPELDLVTGFARNARMENWALNFVHLGIEATTPTKGIIVQISKVYHEVTTRTPEQCESVYREDNGKLHTGRVVESENFNELIQTKNMSNLLPKQSTLGQSDIRALVLSIATPGLLDSFKFVADDDSATALAPDEIEILPKAVGLNFKDVLVALGNIAGNHLGSECAGIVSRVGADAGFEVGDRVCCCTSSGAFKTHVRTAASNAAKIEESMSFSSAAAVPVAFCTAYYALYSVARLGEGESILIHSGAGGVGQAAIQLAKLRKATIFTTVGTTEKRDLLVQRFDIPNTQIFSSRSASFAEAIKNLTSGTGVDVVLNSLSGDLMRASWSCVAPCGRFIEIGKTDIMSGRGLSMDPFLKNVTFSSVDLTVVMENVKRLMVEMMTSIIELLHDGSITPCQPLHVYSISELEKGFRFMQSGKNAGKIIIEMDKDAPVMVVPSSKPSYHFHSNATYVISGGLGGIGRCIIGWMVDRGARFFLVLSRSGATSQGAREFLFELGKKSVIVLAPPCDISSENVVAEVVETYAKTMPAIKGCIQTEIIKDGLFESMTSSDFKACLAPKVQGSWNLHKHLPSDLDFFVMLSSLSSITGSRSQSNYAAACAYQDALARYRMCHGQKAVSLNLGPVLSVGIAADKDLIASLAQGGFEGIRIDEVMALLDWACDPALPIPKSPSQYQVITGFGGARNLKPGQEAYWLQHRHFSVLRNARGSTTAASDSTASEQGPSLGARIADAATSVARQELADQALVAKLARTLNVPAQDIDSGKPIHAFGVDSLVALEMRYWFLKEMRADLAVLEIMGSPSLSVLAGVAAERTEYRAGHKAAAEEDK